MSSKIISGEKAASARPMKWVRSGGPAHADRETPARDAELLHRQQSELEAHGRRSYQKGFEEGQSAGVKSMEGRVDEGLQRVARTVHDITGMKARLRREAEEDVIKLSIAIARRVLYREIQMDTEALHGLVKAALQRVDIRELYRLRMHPEDAGSIQTVLLSEALPARVEIVPDPSLERGAMLLETSRGSLDASIETQLVEIERGFVDLVHGRK
jgi:Flagellar biosynthesis/type III secretory pathway protein